MTRTQVFAAIGAVVLVGVGWFAFDRSPPMVFKSGSVKPEIVSPGQPIKVVIELEWKRMCELDVRRVVRDGAGEEHKLPWSPSAPPPTMPNKPLTSTREIIVPGDAKFGKSACYRATVYMTCGLVDRVWPIKIEIPCIPFEIVPKP